MTPILMYMKEWSIAQARKFFARFLKDAEAEPQAVYNRGRLAGAMLGPREFERYERWRRAQDQESLAQATQTLRGLCESEGYVFEAPPRRDRANPFGADDE